MASLFERFTAPARAVVVIAQEEAAALRHNYVGTEHLLLGLLRVGTGAARRALDTCGVGLAAIRSDVEWIVGIGPASLGDRDAEALRAFGIDLEEVRRHAEESFGPGALERRAGARRGRRGRCNETNGHIPFTPRAKKVLELSLREALRLGDRHIGTEHLLRGLLREEGLAAELLRRRGASLDRVRHAVLDTLANDGDQPGRSA